MKSPSAETLKKIRIEEINKALEVYKQALHESVEASVAEDNAKARKQKAHYNLVMARDALRGIEHEQY